MYHYNHHTYDVAFCIFSCKTLSNFHKLLVKIAMCDENKRIDLVRSIISKYTVFLPKTLSSFFQMQEKLEICHNSILKYLKRPSLRDDKNVTFVP